MSLQQNIHLGLLDYKSNDAYSRTLPLSLKKRTVILRILQLLPVTLTLMHVALIMTTLVTI